MIEAEKQAEATAREILENFVSNSVETEVSNDDKLRLHALFAQALLSERRKMGEEVLACIDREQSYREYRQDQDGSAVGACKEIRSYVRLLLPLSAKGGEDGK